MTTATRDWELWTSPCRLVVTDPEALGEAARLVDARLAEIELACSRFRPDSELLTLSRDATGRFRLSPTLADLVATALAAAATTDGAVDPTIGATLLDLGYDRDVSRIKAKGVSIALVRRPAGWRNVVLDGEVLTMPPGTHLDLGATAKAAAADQCARLVADSLGTGVLVSLGGDIATAGPAPDGGWQVTVRDLPEDPEHQIALAPGAAVATSSTARRTWARNGTPMHHLIDPFTARPAAGPWRTATVLAPTCVAANTAATAALVNGGGAMAWLLRSGLPARLVSHQGTTATVNGWPLDVAA